MIGAVIEARMGSSRLPGKILSEILPGWTMIDVVAARARRSARFDRVVLATSTNPENDAVEAHCRAKGIDVFRGSEDDVLSRVLGAVDAFGLTTLVRLTGDNPLIDGAIIDAMIAEKEAGGLQYVATTMMGHSDNWAAERTFPRGISMEVVDVEVLRERAAEVTDPLEREAITFSVYDNPGRYRIGAFEAAGPFADCRHPELRLTVDTEDDRTLARAVFAEMAKDGDPAGFATCDAVQLVASRPDLAALNAHVRPRVVAEMKKEGTTAP